MLKSRLLGAVGIVAVVGGVLTAQTPASPAFEVASVKPNKSGTLLQGISLPADRFEATNVTLQGLISLAYGEAGPPPKTRANDQIVGAPSWITTDHFDIMAKAGSDVPPGPPGVGQKLLMLQTLLANRFKLTVHHESKDRPAYALVLARSDGKLGSQLHRSSVDCQALLAARGGAPSPPPAPGERPPCGSAMGMGGTMMAGGQTMAYIANMLSRMTNRMVTDHTGLTGTFDADLRFDPEGMAGLQPPGLDRPAPTSDEPSIFTALQEQLGLKLESTTGPVDVLVIDHVEHQTED